MYIKETNGITLIALVITIIVLLILAGVVLNTIIGENSIINNTKDTVILSNIKTLEEGINLYKIQKNLEEQIGMESYPIAKNEDGSYITLSQMKSSSELNKLPDEVKYILLNLTAEKGNTDIPTLEDIDYTKFYKLDASKLSISEKEAENLVIYIDENGYKVINLAGVELQKQDVYVIIPLNNEQDPEYITVANNTYKLYGDGTLKALGEKTVNAGYSRSEVSAINYSVDEFDIEAINARFGNKMALPAKHIYFSVGTAYVIDQNNDLWAWGANDYNKLGLGHSYLVVEPTKILEGRCEGKEGVKAEKVWAGGMNTFVVDTEGILWACGSNGYGALGQGNTNVYSKWVKVSNIDGTQVREIQVSDDSTTNPKIMIIMNNGAVYGAGANNGQWGSLGDLKTFQEIKELSNQKQIELSADSVYFIKEDGSLYGCGWGPIFGQFDGVNVMVENPVKISDNVKQFKTDYNMVTYITEDNKLYRYYRGNSIEVQNAIINDGTIITTGSMIISNGEVYNVSNNGTISKQYGYTNVEPYQNTYGEYTFIQNRGGMGIFRNQEGKIYIKAQPDITRIREKSNYELRKVFENAIFVQGKGSNISIVDRNGKIYESAIATANSKIENARKIVSSLYAKYVIKQDGTLWAKGSHTGMYGELDTKNEYEQITKDGNEFFTNVKDIFTSKVGNSAIFITEDKKMYWAGSDAYIILPQIKVDIYFPGLGYATKYPKEVTSNVLEQIKSKIKDIEYAYINSSGIKGANTLILTEDGKLYTMAENKNMSGNNSIASDGSGDFTELTIKEGATVKQVLTQDGLSLAILSNGEVYGWGYNTYGLLGANYEIGGIYPTPVKLEGLPNNIEYMSLGEGFAIFASKTGEVYGIGKNDYGQLGTGDSIGRNEFVRCPMLEK